MIFSTLVSLAAVVGSVVAAGKGPNPNEGETGDADASSSAVAVPTGSVNATAATSGTGSFQGGTVCVPLMCITGTISGSTVTYALQSSGDQPGWMAMGFGGTMANSPMVIMWPNSDGTMTLSQRMAPAEVMPTVVPNPPRIATAQPTLSVLTGGSATFVYSIPDNGDRQQSIIWAFGVTNPEDSSPSATLLQHIDSGPTTIDLAGTVNSVLGPDATPSNSSSGGSTTTIPYLPYQKLIIAHATFSAFGFLIVLPFGVLIARYLRTTAIVWFKGHWFVQFVLGGTSIVIGFALALAAVHTHRVPNFNDNHKIIGLVLFLLYVVQVSLGSFVHFIKIGWSRGRPPQNYVHAVLGLSIIGLALYQVHLGYSHEWPNATGRGPVPRWVGIIWIILLILLPVLYIGGLVFVPQQYKLEREARRARQEKTSRSDPSYQDIPRV